MHLDVLLEWQRTGTPHLTTTRHFVASSARRVSAPVSPFSETLICCLRADETGKWVERGCLHTPTAKGSRSGGSAGALRSFTRAGVHAAHRAKPRPGLRFAPAGLRGNAALGERESAAAGYRSGSAPARSCWARARESVGERPLRLAVRLCSDGGHPGGRGSGERREYRRHYRDPRHATTRRAETAAKCGRILGLRVAVIARACWARWA
jgi:hypothetical protein